jgi:hypothetical protein
MPEEKKTVGGWLMHGIRMSWQTETMVFCDCLNDVLVEMLHDGVQMDAVLEHLLSMADQFIEVAQAFKKEFGSQAPVQALATEEAQHDGSA